MPEQVSPSTEKSSTPAADPAGSIVDDEAPNVTAALSPGTEMVTGCVAVAKSLTVPKPTLAGAVRVGRGQCRGRRCRGEA